MSKLFYKESVAESAEWDDLWRNCHYATYFQSREWAEIWNAYTKDVILPDPRVVEFSDGKRVIIPVSSQRILLGMDKCYFMSPAGTFGGWITKDAISGDHVNLLRNYITDSFRNLTWRLNPYDPNMKFLVMKDLREDNTRALNLKAGLDVIYKNWTKGHRSAVTKAIREGVSIGIAKNSDEWAEYYQIYVDSLRRWGEKATSRYDRSLFEAMYKRKSPFIKLWIAKYNNVIIAGSLCFYAKKHVAYWHGAALEKYFFLRPVNLILYESIKNACEDGYAWFDFNPSSGHKGVERFKKSFDAKAYRSDIYIKKTIPAKLIEFIMR